MRDDDDDEKTELQKEEEAAEQEVAALEDDPPQDLQDWPDGDAKYKTFGGPDAESGYDDGPTANLGDSDVRHLEDGGVTVNGEEVDNPEDYKGEPIPGGPTDPDSAEVSGDKVGAKDEDDSDSDDDDSDSKDDGDGDSEDSDDE